MRIRIVAVGKLSSLWKAPCEEYRKRLSKYCALDIFEISEGMGEPEKIKRAEWERMRKLIPQNWHVIALDVAGKQMDSAAFAHGMQEIFERGKDICFLLGGSEGFAPDMREFVQERISFSPMTFHHQMARAVLLEQIYRGFKIIKNEPYHK